MHRSLPARLSALLWAVLFLLRAGGDGLGLHPCPHHAAPEAAAHAAPAAEHGAPHPGHAAAAPARRDGHGAPGEHSGGCTCLGACQAGTGAPLPAAPALAFRAVAEAGDQPAPAAARTLPPGLPPYFLPYALAPPVHG